MSCPPTPPEPSPKDLIVLFLWLLLTGLICAGLLYGTLALTQ